MNFVNFSTNRIVRPFGAAKAKPIGLPKGSGGGQLTGRAGYSRSAPSVGAQFAGGGATTRQTANSPVSLTAPKTWSGTQSQYTNMLTSLGINKEGYVKR
jgi:hypothetical protein